MTNNNKMTNRLVVTMLSLLMLFSAGPFFNADNANTYAANASNITTWAELKEAIEVDKATSVTITKNLYADESINVTTPVTINGSGDNGVTIYQKQRDKYDTMFKVTSGGNLTLGTKLTLSGKTAKCNDGSTQAETGTEPNNHTLSEFVKQDSAGNSKGSFTALSDQKKLSNSSGNQINLVDSSSGYPLTEFEIENGMLKYNNQYVITYTDGNYQLNNNSNNALILVKAEADSQGHDVIATSIEQGGSYLLKDQYPGIGGYIGLDGNYLVSKTARDNALVLKAGGVTPGATGDPYWMIPNKKPLDDENNLVRYDTEDAAKAALKTLNEVIDPIEYKYIPGADLSVITNKYYYYPAEDTWVNSNGKTIEEAIAEYNAAHQGCDGPECAGASTYTKTSFADGTITQPHGFFVQVQDTGKATLNGASLENFITSRDKGTTPRYVAPVTVWGTGSAFNVESGYIKDNIVGYLAGLDEMSNKSANEIKSYIKGGAPNAARKGTYATRRYRRKSNAGIDNNDAGSGITATAGAIIYANGGKGEITGGDIGFNRGDTGGIMATGEDTEVALKNNANINNNVGVQFGGGVTTEDGATINMHDGIIQKNVAWFGGGGVYATENGVEWLLGNRTLEGRKDGKFNMFDGTIAENTAFTRGGGFFVDSDGVSLLKGTIKDNLSHMLGGAMYVMGDDANFTYTVYINKGYVHENKAVSAGPANSPYQDEDNKKLSQLLSAPSGCNRTAQYKLLDGYMTVNSDDINDGYPNKPHDASDGTGGGIWLCAYGNTVLNVGDDSFIIDKNYATGSFRHGKAAERNKVPESTSSDKAGGNDIHKETKGSGNIVIFGITDNSVQWHDENTGEQYTTLANAKDGAITDYSLKNLVNKGSKEPPSSDYDSGKYQGVDVFGNMSRRGGGLAADGTFLFGNFRALGQAYSELAVTKTWAGGTKPEKVTIRISLEYKDGNETKTIPVIELPLDKDAVPGSELDTVFTDGSVVVDGKTVYKGHIVLPITVDDGTGKQIQLFDLVSDVDGHIFALDNAQSLYELGSYLKNGGQNGAPGTVSLSTVNRKLVYEELVDDGTGNLVKATGFEITPSSIRLSTDPPPQIHETEIKQAQAGGGETTVGTMITSDIRFEADLVNDKPSEIDKYVNKAVHKDIALDEEFEYDVIAYVKHGTDKIIIEDQLVDDLEFVSTPAEVKVVSLDENNHLPQKDINGKLVNKDASVAQPGSPIDNKTVDISGDNKLTVTIENKLEEVTDKNNNVIGYKNADDEQYLTALWGKWVKVTYKARIKKALQDKIKAGQMKVGDLKSVTVKDSEKYKADSSIFDNEERPTPNVGNDPVKSDEDHKGIANTASYSLEVKNEPAFRDESNTVTVKPEYPEVEKYVNQSVHKDIACDEVFTYDIIGYISKDADKVVFEDKLVSDLEFVNPDDIEVKYLADNNHKPKYDVNGVAIPGNDDASVASDKWVDVPTDGLEKSASNSTGILKVTIDDIVETSPSGDVIDRQRYTVFNLRGKYVKVTFKAQIKKSIQEEIKNKTKSIADLSSVTIKATENNPVLSDEAHSGIMNEAKLSIYVGKHPKYELFSNKVTVKPKDNSNKDDLKPDNENDSDDVAPDNDDDEDEVKGADTGDEAKLMPWMMMLILSAAAVTTGAVYRRKRSR